MRIFGETYERRAEVATIGGLSAHAGQTFLVEYAEAVKDSVRQIFLVHGEPKAAQALQEKLADRGMDEIYYPEMHEGVEDLIPGEGVFRCQVRGQKVRRAECGDYWSSCLVSSQCSMPSGS